MKTTRSIPYHNLEFDCEPCEGEFLDTRVTIDGQPLCWITWKDVDNFANEINDVINKYAI